MTKKIVLSAILIIFLAAVYMNGNAKDVTVASIEKQMIANTNIENMTRCNNLRLREFIGLNYEDYDSYMYYKGKEALSVDEVLIVKAKNKDDLAQVKDLVEDRISSQTATFEGYGPTQVAELKNAIVETKGVYLFYCVAKNPDKYEEVFKDAI